jgi:hypothetical protein
MSHQTSAEWRDDDVAIGHGDHEPIPPGVERDAIDALRFLAAGRFGLSVPGPDALEAVGITPGAVADAAFDLVTAARAPRPVLSPASI